MRCLWCHKDVSAGWALCPDCGAQLDAGPDEGAFVPTYRPSTERPFDPFVIASVRRITATGPLVLLGKHERIEANLTPGDDAVVCRDLNGPVLFRLERYTPVGGGVVAFTDDDEPIATYLPDGPTRLEVRDGASAPVATLAATPGSEGNWDLVERGSRRRLASCWRQPYQRAEWVDEQWFVLPTAEGRVPLSIMGMVAIPVVCHAWLGRPRRAVEDPDDDAVPFGIDETLSGFLGGRR